MLIRFSNWYQLLVTSISQKTLVSFNDHHYIILFTVWAMGNTFGQKLVCFRLSAISVFVNRKCQTFIIFSGKGFSGFGLCLKIKVSGKTPYWWSENAKTRKNLILIFEKKQNYTKKVLIGATHQWCSENYINLKKPFPVTTYNPLACDHL